MIWPLAPSLMEFQIPRIVHEEVEEQRGMFVIEPLDRGFGYTFGNSLRRVLLSSLEGAAVTSVKIEFCWSQSTGHFSLHGSSRRNVLLSAPPDSNPRLFGDRGGRRRLGSFHSHHLFPCTALECLDEKTRPETLLAIGPIITL